MSEVKIAKVAKEGSPAPVILPSPFEGLTSEEKIAKKKEVLGITEE